MFFIVHNITTKNIQHICSFVNTNVVNNVTIKTVMKMYYNEKMQLARESKNITQKEMAEYLGIKLQQYARYEKGINIMPVTHLKKICEKLGVSADYIIGLPQNLEYPQI